MSRITFILFISLIACSPRVEAPPASIGQATMASDGTLTLDLRAEDGKGAIGDGRLVYPPSHSQYREILQHLGGMKPGETKPVPPWDSPPSK